MNPWEFIGWTAVILNELQRLDIKIGIPFGGIPLDYWDYHQFCKKIQNCCIICPHKLQKDLE